MARPTPAARAYARACKDRKEAARQWTALAFLLAAGERFTFPQVRKMAARVAATDTRVVETSVVLYQRTKKRRRL